ncbi:MAG: hypothetical protein PF485_06490 [Bacteroidales bacterium]|jgi:ABC-type nickel/cobalt efflux system permease component RcnA|nr:hypothetical protein [Bacteroidales bacterium]
MKKLLFVLFTYTFILFVSSCGNKTQNDHSGAHAHDDGTVHQDSDHASEEVVAPEQEGFTVEADSIEAQDHNHDHEDGHDHQH